MTELIACPRCGASPSAAPDARGQYVCAYCGSHYHAQLPFAAQPALVSSQLQPLSRKKSAAVSRGLAALGALLLLFAVGGLLAVFQNRTSSRNENSDVSPASANDGSLASSGASEQPASATFEAHGHASGYQSSFYVLGFVKNTSPFTIDKPKVTAVLFDEAGKELATRDGYAEGEVLASQASAPVKILVSDPPKYARIGFEVVARKASYLPEDSAGLRLEILEAPHSTGGGSWELTGKVFNEGKLASRFVNILVLALDAKERLLGLDSTFVDGESIAPGASARFRAMPLYDAPPNHFKYVVSGRAQR